VLEPVPRATHASWLSAEGGINVGCQPIVASSRFCFIYCEMRASNLSLVIATVCCLLWTVRAQTGEETFQGGAPSNITVVPTTLIANEPFTVSWQDGTANCFIGGVNLVEIDDIGSRTVLTVLRKLPSVQRPNSKESC
jgi:hypothetical protein